MILFVSGCSQVQNTHTMIFEEKIRIEYGQDVNTAKFVKRIDSFLIDDSMIEENKIHVSNFSVQCPNIEIKKLGKIQLTYLIDEERYTTTAEVIDSTKPKIQLTKEDLTFEVDELKDIKDYIRVTDNYDKDEEIVIEIKGDIEKNKVGTYPVEIIATDSSKNRAKKSVDIIIKDSKKEEEQKKAEEIRKQQEQEKQNNSANNNAQQSHAQSGSSNSDNGGSIQNTNPSITSRDYLFSAGYDMSTAPSACQADLMASGRSGQCIPLKDADGLYIGMRLTLN